ncbi:MAG: hypothetical protein EA423_11165 [Phycisphaerales bacterium]|nr:MAG: hypothetical protein EA423_11165 [Phycisphaerales bacterium]
MWLDPDMYERAVAAAEEGDYQTALLWISKALSRFSMLLTANADQLDALRRDLSEPPAAAGLCPEAENTGQDKGNTP